ncbi:nucleotidyltransferase domain-containing protein [Candidatus Woesearchaeota archaeon]|nr:nucleotidyltransferase domain-containing protein [Candidatus Woesearchaeota archaeon]
MLTKEYTLLELFVKEPWKKLTFKQVKTLSKQKSDNYVHTRLKKLVKEEILKEERVGNNILYKVNNNVNSLNMLGFVAEFIALKDKHIPRKNIEKIANKIKTPYFTLIITGSYAKKQHKQTSDLDIVIICDYKQNPDQILSQIKTEAEMMIPEIHPHVFTQAQFYEMLTNKEENYGKETARHNLIITGAKQYLSIMMEAINHGFDG